MEDVVKDKDGRPICFDSPEEKKKYVSLSGTAKLKTGAGLKKKLKKSEEKEVTTDGDNHETNAGED